MNDKNPLAPVQLKEIPSTLRQRPSAKSDELTDELRKAKDSWYYYWYLTLKQSNEYRQCCRGKGAGRLKTLYYDFGDVVTLPFPIWWQRHGRNLFAERKPIPTVNVYTDQHDAAAIKSMRNKLLIEVPLDLRQSTVVRKINKILKEAYAGREVKPRQKSTALRKLEPTKLRKETVETVLNLYDLRAHYPKLTLWQLGEKARIELDFMARTTDAVEMTLAQERVRMAIAVSRYLKQATNLIWNATEGIFPSIKPALTLDTKKRDVTETATHLIVK
jgi:hypothetical protein